MRLFIIFFLSVIISYSCTWNKSAGAEKPLNELVEDSIRFHIGEFDIVDSATIHVRNDLIYFSWIVHLKSQNDYALCVLSWENTLQITDINTDIIDCGGTKYADYKAFPYIINSRSNKDFVITGNDVRFTFSVESDGAYLDSVFLYRKSFGEDSVLLESAKLDRSNFGKMRIKDFSNDLFDKHHWNFQVVSDFVGDINNEMEDSEETEEPHWILKNSLLDNHSLQNLVREETIRQIQWFDIAELFKESPLDKNNISIYSNAAVVLIKNEMYNEARIMLLEITEKYPEREDGWLALADAQWGNGDEEEAKKSYRNYLDLMKKYHKDLMQIPKRVAERVN